jgi:hypothetical protein
MSMRRELHPKYGARSPLGFWFESAFIALMAIGFIAMLIMMVVYA